MRQQTWTQVRQVNDTYEAITQRQGLCLASLCVDLSYPENSAPTAVPRPDSDLDSALPDSVATTADCLSTVSPIAQLGQTGLTSRVEAAAASCSASSACAASSRAASCFSCT